MAKGLACTMERAANEDISWLEQNGDGARHTHRAGRPKAQAEGRVGKRKNSLLSVVKRHGSAGC